MPQVKIDITVDVAKLLEVQPGGGQITDQSIISMNQTGGDTKDGTQGTAKLSSIAAIGSKVKWKIKSGTTSDNLEMIDYVPEDENMLKVFKVKPTKQSNSDDEIDGDVRDDQPTENINTQYTLEFCIKKNPTTTWTWDPNFGIPLPPI